MSCEVVIRGNTVVFTATFYDQDGVIISPPGANVRVTYNVATVQTTEVVPMVGVADVWTADWDSRIADSGAVYWHTESEGTPSAADDGSFTLSANAANPQT